MSVINLIDRQYNLTAMADLGIAYIGAANTATIVLPPGALLLSLVAYVDTAFNSATTDTMTVGDGTTTFVSAVDLKTVGSKTVANAPKFYPSGGTLTITLAETGATATLGRVLMTATYLTSGKGGEIQG